MSYTLPLAITKLICLCLLTPSLLLGVSVYQETGGMLIMEMENTASPLGLWQLKTNYADYTGTGHLEFSGNATASGPATSPLQFHFKLNDVCAKAHMF